MTRKTTRGQKVLKNLERKTTRAGRSVRKHLKENILRRWEHIRNVRLLVLEWWLLVVAIIILAVTQVFLYNNSYSEEAPIAGGTYTEATLGEIKSLNPLFASSSSEKVLAKLLFAGLMKVDASGHIGLDLAAKVSPTDGGKVWRVSLKPNLKWSDGEDLTIDDVIFTASLIQNKNLKTNYDKNLAGVKVSREGEEAIFTLATEYADFNASLDFPILPKHILEKVEPGKIVDNEFSSSPIGAGPFILKATQENSDTTATVFLDQNEHYYQGEAIIETFAVQSFDKAEDIIKALNEGAVSGTAELSALDAEAIKSDKIIERAAALSSGVYAFFNTTNGAFSNRDLRQAVRQGMNMSEVRVVTDGEQALDYPMLGLANYPEIPGYDLNAAKEAIGKIEFDRETPVSVATVENGYLPKIAEKIVEQLKKMGVNAEMTAYEPSQDFIQSVIQPRSYDILVYEVDLGATTDLFAYYHSSQATSTGLNLSNYHSAIADDLIIGARTTTDGATRATKNYQFMRRWVMDVPAIGIYQTNMTYYYNRETTNFPESQKLVTALDRFEGVIYWSAQQGSRNKTP